MATGVETSGAAKRYEFGDTLNLDIGQTLFSALQREGVKLPLNLEYRTCTCIRPNIKAPARRC